MGWVDDRLVFRNDGGAPVVRLGGDLGAIQMLPFGFHGGLGRKITPLQID